jgi:plastocyanin
MTRTRPILAALALSVVLVAAGCGSSDSSDGATSDAGSSTTAAAGGASSATAPVALEGAVNDEGTKDISGDGSEVQLSMTLADNSFSPTYVKAAPGATVTVALQNDGQRPHTFTLDDESVDETLQPGRSATVTVTVPESGSLRFSCDFHAGMGLLGAFYTGGDDAPAASTTTDAPAGGSPSGY